MDLWQYLICNGKKLFIFAKPINNSIDFTNQRSISIYLIDKQFAMDMNLWQYLIYYFLYHFWFNGVGTAGLLAVLDASPAPASSVPPMASSPPPSICCSAAGLLPAAQWLAVAGARPPAATRWRLAAARRRKGGREEGARPAAAWSAATAASWSAAAVHRALELEQGLDANWNERCRAPLPLRLALRAKMGQN